MMIFILRYSPLRCVLRLATLKAALENARASASAKQERDSGGFAYHLEGTLGSTVEPRVIIAPLFHIDIRIF
jgi:hypothetical protein